MIPILVNGNLPTIVSSSNLQSTPMNLKSVKDSTEQSSKKKTCSRTMFRWEKWNKAAFTKDQRAGRLCGNFIVHSNQLRKKKMIYFKLSYILISLKKDLFYFGLRIKI